VLGKRAAAWTGLTAFAYAPSARAWLDGPPMNFSGVAGYNTGLGSIRRGGKDRDKE
jgi:hypothetical protein